MDKMNSSTAAIPEIPLMICGICEKPFTRDLQYKRHVAYCRKAKSRKRPRSCRACNQAKIKCNSCDPCHQCTRKGAKCMFDQQYDRRREDISKNVAEAADLDVVVNPAALVASKTSTFPEMDTSRAEAEVMSPGLEKDDLLASIGQAEAIDCYSLPDSFQSGLYSSKEGPQPMNRMNSQRVPFQEPFTALDTVSSMTRFEENAFQTLLNQTFNTSLDGFTFPLGDSSFYMGQDLQLASLPSDRIIPIAQMVPSQSDWTEISHFSRNVRTGIQQICVTMINEMVSAYPRMMTRRETVPPFIHAHTPSPTITDHNALPEHIANCMGVAQLFTVRNNDTRPFIWATIRTEMKCFKNKLQSFGKYDVLSALQASLLYIIMRAVEDVPQQASDDYAMLSTYNDLILRIIELTDYTCGTVDKGQITCWKDWIFMESLRRIACLWFILGLCFHIRTGQKCAVHEHFRELFLPCPKSEWEAKTEEDWEKEHISRNAGNAAAMETVGDLVDTHLQAPDPQTFAKLSSWNAGIDHLGMILNLAIRLV